MIDIHCHILPGLDDGSPDIEHSLRMGHEAAAEGITHLVATPHLLHGHGDEEIAFRNERFAELGEEFRRHDIAVQLVAGFECRVYGDYDYFLGSAKFIGIGGGRAILVELPWELIPPGFDNFLFAAVSRGIIPVVAHPERHHAIQARPELLASWVAAGAWIQINAGSLAGEFGRKAKKTSKRILKEGWCQCLASDAHAERGKETWLAKGLDQAGRILGDRALELVTTNPAVLLGLNS